MWGSRACRFGETIATLLMIVAAIGATPVAQTRSSVQQARQSGTPVTITGELSAIYADDFANKRSELVYVIRDERSNRVFRVHFEREPPREWRKGSSLTVSGRMNGSEIDVLADQMSDATVQSTTSSTTSAQPAVQGASPVAGEQTTVVMVANFQDKNVSCSIAEIEDMLFTNPSGRSVDGLYRHMSGGNLSFTGTVVGPYSLNMTSTDPCNYVVWSDAMNAAAASNGVDVNAYSRRVYVMPSSTCPAAGYAELDETPGRSWMFVCNAPDVFSHELGHNLGLQHASSPTHEYGDGSDYMGLGRGLFRELSAPHKFQMGWIPPSLAPVITQDGEYNIAPVELNPTAATAPQTLKVFKADSSEYYYLSYRRGIGFDTELCCAYLDRLSVHRWTAGSDLTWPKGNTYLLAMLADGETYSDPVTGFTVTQLSHDDNSTRARVQLGQGCGSARPSLTLAPQDQSGSPGTTLRYDVEIVNNDSSTCSPAVFSLANTTPLGWSGSLSQTSLQIAPGNTGRATLMTTSATTASPGTYVQSVSVNDVHVAEHNAAVNGSYTVASSCLKSPALTISPLTQSASPGTTLNYSVSVTNRDAAGCPQTSFTIVPSAPNGATATLSPSSVTLAPGASTDAVYSLTPPAGAAVGTYGFSATISDGINPAHNTSASASYSVVEAQDAVPPSSPTGLVATVKAKQVALSWRAAADNVAVTGYHVLSNGVPIGTTTSRTWTVTGLAAGSYAYSVLAFDGAGNLSGPSNTVTVKIGGKGR